MSLLGKKVGQFKQWTAERAGKAEKTDVGDDFKQLEQVVDAKKDQLEKLATETKHYLQTSGKMKFIPQTTAKHHSMSTLGYQMIACGSSFPEGSTYGNSLIKCGEAFEKTGQCQQETESRMNESFLQPLLEVLDGDLKEWQHQKKKLENRRLDFDAKNAKLRGSKVPTPDLENEVNGAKAKFEETLLSCRELMEKIVSENEDNELQRLAELVEAQRAFFEKGLNIFTQLASVLVDPSVQGSRAAGQGITDLQRKESTITPTPRRPSLTSGEAPDTSAPSRDPIPKPKPKPSPAASAGAPPLVETSPAAAAAGAGVPVPKARPKPGGKVEKRVGLYAFAPENEDELPFGKGDVITVLEKNDDGWWIGELDGRKGVFPSNYTSPFDG